MNSRKFTVFIDDVSTAKPQQAPKSPSNRTTEEDAGVSSLSATEKENLHPLTGGRLRSSSTAGLKRKSSVLTIKLHNPPDTKATRQVPTHLPAKKRKVASPSDGEAERSRLKARRVKSIASQKRSPELASIAEEKDERLSRRLSQSDVDSRCYNLTVSPLANVLDASAHPSPSGNKTTKAKATLERTDSAEPEIRDYVRCPADAVTTVTSTPTRRSTRGISLPPPTLSTPERKRIYASFTFSSPIRGSPERKRKRLVTPTFEDLPAAF